MANQAKAEAVKVKAEDRVKVKFSGWNGAQGTVTKVNKPDAKGRVIAVVEMDDDERTAKEKKADPRQFETRFLEVVEA